MNEQDLLNKALAQLHTGQWFGWRTHDDNGNKIPNNQRMSYENIIIHYNSITMPTKTQVEAKIQELKDLEITKEQNKKSALTKLSALGLTEAEIKAIIG
jgi:hypothetical protein